MDVLRHLPTLKTMTRERISEQTSTRGRVDSRNQWDWGPTYRLLVCGCNLWKLQWVIFFLLAIISNEVLSQLDWIYCSGLRTDGKRGDCVRMMWRCSPMPLEFAVFSWWHRNFFLSFIFCRFCFVCFVLNVKVKEKLCVSCRLNFGLVWPEIAISYLFFDVEMYMKSIFCKNLR